MVTSGIALLIVASVIIVTRTINNLIGENHYRINTGKRPNSNMQSFTRK